MFLEIDKDRDVLKAIRLEAEGIGKILKAPRILEMPTPVRIHDSVVDEYNSNTNANSANANTNTSTKSVDSNSKSPFPWMCGKLQRDGSSNYELDLNTAGIAGHLVRRVLLALETLFLDQDSVKKKAPQYWDSKYGQDTLIQGGVELRVNHRTFCPADLLLLQKEGDEQEQDTDTDIDEDRDKDTVNKGEKEDKSALTPAAVDALLSALTVQIPHAGDVRFSVFQYFALLDVHGSSEEVIAALRENNFTNSTGHPGQSTDIDSETPVPVQVPVVATLNSNKCLLDLARVGAGSAVRAGAGEGEGTHINKHIQTLLGSSVQPLVSLAVQLQVAALSAAATQLQNKEKENKEEEEEQEIESTEEEDANEDEVYIKEQKEVCIYMQALERLSEAQCTAKGEMKTGSGNAAEAEDLVSSALDEARGLVGEGRDGEGGGLPTQVRRRGGARIRWRQMSSLDQRGHFDYEL